MKLAILVHAFRKLQKSMSRLACFPPILLLVLLLVLLVVLGGCSKTAPTTGDGASQGAAKANANIPAGNACDRKLVTSADAAEILGAPVASEEALRGDPQSCVFSTADSNTLTIALRPGLGRATLDTYAAGKMPMPVTNVPGVGERAVWQTTPKEINAEKNNVLCDIEFGGSNHNAGATPEKLGALCNKIFAGM